MIMRCVELGFVVRFRLLLGLGFKDWIFVAVIMICLEFGFCV